MTSESLPSTQSAIVAGPDGELLVRNDVPLPAVGAGMVLVEIEAVALNPVDTKMVGSLATPGAVSGFDFAGEVVAVPSDALLRVPGSMSLEEACSLGVGIGTAGLALFRALELHVSPQTVLVYGGSTATGTLMLQFLKLYGPLFSPCGFQCPHRRF
jgi:NADPH:quinone reductase-like Zn-dependent oxidoreductase